MDNSSLKKIAENARITAKRFDWVNIGKIYREYIDRIIAER
jgi:hypothetical protein